MSTPPTHGIDRANQVFNLRLWLLVSMLANVGLGVFSYYALKPLGVPAVPSVLTNGSESVRTNVVVRHENFTWDQVDSTNYVLFVKNLRAVGCPEQTIRDIILSEVNRIYAHRRLTEVNYPNYQWWRSDPETSAVESAAAKIETIEAERRGVVLGLLGPGAEDPNNEQMAAAAGITLTGPVLGDLAPNTKETVYAVVAKAQRKIAAYLEDQRLKGRTADPMEIVRLRNEMLAQLGPPMLPAEYQEFALRYSPAAQQLRALLRSVQLGPDEFRNLFAADSSIVGQPMYYYAGNDSTLRKQEQSLDAQSDAIFKSILADQLYTAYELNQDPLYRSSRTTVEQLGVPEATVTPLYEINRATQAELDRIRKDTDLSPDEQVEAMAQAKMEQEQSLAQILGPEAFERWLQTHTGVQ
jgi:hypothetical protein